MKTKHIILIIVVIIGAYLAYKYLVVGPEISHKRIFSREDFLQKPKDWKVLQELDIDIQKKDLENFQMASTNKFEKIL